MNTCFSQIHPFAIKPVRLSDHIFQMIASDLCKSPIDGKDLSGDLGNHDGCPDINWYLANSSSQ
jgi:hypothetical protein